MLKLGKIIKEYMRSDDIYDLTALLFAGKSVIAIMYNNGDIEYVDEEYYSESGKEEILAKKGARKNIEKVYKISAEEMIG